MSTLSFVGRLRGGARPRSYRGTRPRFASGTLMSLRTAPTPQRAPRQPPSSRLKGRQPSPPQFARHGAHTKPPQTFHHPNTKPPSNTLNRDSPPRHSSLGTGRTRNPRNTPTEPGGIPRTPEPQTRRGIDIPRRDIRVSELCEDGSPVGARGNIYTPKPHRSFSQGNTKIPPIPKNQRDFL